jgi:hypothetical protein
MSSVRAEIRRQLAMRPRRLVSIAALGATLALSVSTQALARPGGACRIGINVAPRLIEAGESAVIFGRLRCPGPPRRAADRTVRVLQRVARVPGLQLATVTTDSSGFYELVRSGIEYNSSFSVTALGATSQARPIRVLAHVSLAGPPDGSQIFTGRANRVTFSGSVSPHDVGARVVLQRQSAIGGDQWRRIDVGLVGPGGSYSITHTFVVPGDANIRVLVHSQRRNVASPSEVLTYEISQAQNPQLTIEGSPNPITFGGHVTISGTVAGAPDTQVTLLAHAAGQPFLAVATAKTDSSGNYTLPAQSPAASTFYQVSAAGRLSAVLFEGVRDLLTAQVSASTIAGGQTLTFSGAVAPDHTGHVIYLQRRDATGVEFHVVQVAVVGAGSAYSIAHTVYEPGVKVFRLYIPGGPDNEGAASAPFTVNVLRAPAARLSPEAPGNSTQPSQGEG